MTLTTDQLTETARNFAFVTGCSSFKLDDFDYEHNPYIVFHKGVERYRIPVSVVAQFAVAVKHARELFEGDFWQVKAGDNGG